MIHGIQKLTLTHASVQEALQDYLQGHMGSDVVVRIKSWMPNSDTYGENSTVSIEFEQVSKEPTP